MNLINYKFYIDSFILFIVTTLLCVKSEETFRRKLSYNLYCNTSAAAGEDFNGVPNLNIVHVTADGPEDTIHYLWTTYSLPTIIISRTAHNTSLDINCEDVSRFQEGSISFSNPPQYSTALVLNELWQYIDYDDLVNITHGSNITKYSPNNFSWSSLNESLSFSDNMVSAFSAANGTDEIFLPGGTFKVQFSVSATVKQSTKYPHLWFTGNATEMSLYLIDLGIFDGKSRFAAGLTVLTSSSNKELWRTKKDETMNDEYSPGVFTVKSVLSPCEVSSEKCKGFVSWKPVAYIGSIATVANSSDAKMSPLEVEASCPPSIAAAFFGKAPLSIVSWKMIFGTSGDGFYTATNYTTWSMMMGLGHPISDSLSTLAIFVITVGLGTPFLIVVAGTMYMGYKKCRKDDDDLLLDG